MKGYELLYIVGTQYTDEEVGGIQETIAKFLGDLKAKVLRNENLGKIRLAYPIKKENEAEFGFLCFKSLPDKIQLIDKELRLVSYALRFLLIAREKVVSHNISKHEEVSSAPTSPQITPESQAAPAKNMLSNEELKARLEEILK